MNKEQFFGSALVMSGPSGVGKSSILRSMGLTLTSQMHFSVSRTTRARRNDEIDGQAYHFISEDEYQKHVDNGDFLEHAEVHSFYYGTLKKELDFIKNGWNVVMDIDVQGMRQVKSSLAGDPFYSPRLLTVFIMPPSFKELERRLRGRKTEAEDAIQRRLRNAVKEMEAWREYDYLIINEDSEATAMTLVSILNAAHYKTDKLTEETWKNEPMQ